jgi:hypothetical protein
VVRELGNRYGADNGGPLERKLVYFARLIARLGLQPGLRGGAVLNRSIRLPGRAIGVATTFLLDRVSALLCAFAAGMRRLALTADTSAHAGRYLTGYHEDEKECSETLHHC